MTPATSGLGVVLISPRNEENPYLTRLREGLSAQGVRTEWFAMDATRSQTLNALLVPIQLLARRRRGARVLHLHWTYLFAWPWTRRLPVLRVLPREWLSWCLWWANAIGIRVVVTWHDLVPHRVTFDDDRAGRAVLAKRSHELVVLTEAAKRQLVSEYSIDPERIHVIGEGPPVVADDVEAAQGLAYFDVQERPLLVAFGHIDPYKGVDVFLDAALGLPDTTVFSIRVLGAAAEPAHAAAIEERITALRARGRDAAWRSGAFTDHELELLLACADVVVHPFLRITNSGSIRAAMARGVPVVLPDLASLVDVPREVAFWFDPKTGATLRDVLSSILAGPLGARADRAEAARTWIGETSWEDVASATRIVYERALGVTERDRRTR